MFDIATLDTRTKSEAGVEMKIRHPLTGVPLLDDKKEPVTITMRGRNSEDFKRLQREFRDQKTDRAARDIRWTEEDNKRERFEVLCGMTLGWSFDMLGGEPFPFSPENVKKLWSDGRWEWLADTAFGFVLNEGNFTAL